MTSHTLVPSSNFGVNEGEYLHEAGQEVLGGQLVRTLYREGEVGVRDPVADSVPRVPGNRPERVRASLLLARTLNRRLL